MMTYALIDRSPVAPVPTGVPRVREDDAPYDADDGAGEPRPDDRPDTRPEDRSEDRSSGAAQASPKRTPQSGSGRVLRYVDVESLRDPLKAAAHLEAQARVLRDHLTAQGPDRVDEAEFVAGMRRQLHDLRERLADLLA